MSYVTSSTSARTLGAINQASNHTDPTNVLFPEVLKIIFRYLNFKQDVQSCRLTTRRWTKLINEMIESKPALDLESMFLLQEICWHINKLAPFMSSERLLQTTPSLQRLGSNYPQIFLDKEDLLFIKNELGLQLKN